MSWVRVHCTEHAARFFAPSFSSPPALEGFDQLFNNPSIKLRFLHCFPINAGATAAVAADDMTASREVMVLFDQLELGGSLGTVTIAVGGESTGTTKASLSLLMQMVVFILNHSDDHGVQLLLDAITTLPPTPFNAERDVAADDGLPRVASLEATGVPLKNREFLNKVRPSGSDVLSQKDARRRSLGCGALSSSLSTTPGATGEEILPPLDYAQALRRATYLYFVQQHVVPLSLLASEVTKSSSSSSSNSDYPYVSCQSSLLRGGSGEKLKKHSYWRYLANRAEAHMSSALAAIQSLLTAACPSHMEAIFQREMWLCSDISDGEQLPIAAAFSPSGLLFSSQLFQSSLVHSEKVLMSALAIDRLCRGGLATTPSGVLRVARFPWMLQDRKRVVDWCVVSLGDALALCIGFPRARNEASGPIVESLMRYIDGLRTAGQPSPGADLLHLCTHSTHPLTSHYYQAMLGLTELQLSSATWRDGFSTSFHPTNGSAAEVASSGAAAAPPPISPRKKKGLSRLMCCMPFQLHKKPTAAAASFETPATATPAEAQDGAATQAAVEAPPSTGSTKRAVVRSPFTGGLPTLCYVASGISQAELECFRPLDGLGVHSMFFLLRTEHTAEKGHVPSQYGMGFYRPRLQSAEYENDSSDAAMLARRGCMAIHDPARILDVLGVTGATWLHTKPQDMEPMGQSLLMPTQMLSEAVPLSWVQLGTADAVLARYDMLARASTDGKTSVMIDDYEGDADTEEDEDDTLTSYYFTRSKKGFCMEEIVTVEGDYLHVDTVMSKALSTRSKITSAPDNMDRESGAQLKTLGNAIIQCQRAAQAVFDVALGQ